jgi:predicted nucleic acid-binding protein
VILLDTNVAIDLRDGHAATEAAVVRLEEYAALSIVTRIELEGGVYRDPALASVRRILTDRILAGRTVLDLSGDDVLAYGRIVAAAGFDRRRVLDRLIAAQCLVRRAALVTRNARGFADIEGLQLIHW